MTNPIDELIEKLNLSKKEGYDWAERKEGSDGSGLMAQLAWRCAESASALSTLQEQKRKLEEALSDLEQFGTAILAAMDEHNAKNATHLGGPAFFKLGRGIAKAREALLSGGGE